MQCIYDTYASGDKHRITEAEEAVFLLNSGLVGSHRLIIAVERLLIIAEVVDDLQRLEGVEKVRLRAVE